MPADRTCLILNDYEILFKDGGLEVSKNGELLYFNHRPVYVSVKDYGGIQRFRDVPYEKAEALSEGTVAAEGRFLTENSSCLYVRDLYSIEGACLKIARKVTVETADEANVACLEDALT